ncbi:MAG: GlcG/HbpS family heme-binding protein [Beijerinckiaceae bacterium]
MLSLAAAQTIIDAALQTARAGSMKPLSVVVLDARGAVRAVATEDNASLKRYEIAHAKAHGALAMGMGSRALMTRAESQGYFIAAASHVVGPLVPVPGGVLIRDAGNMVIGAVGISGDTSDNDEAAAKAGIAKAGFVGDGG